MRKWLNSSFRRKLMAAFLAVGVIPLLTCTVLMLNDKRLGISATILAVLVAFSRLYLYVHYPTDVLAAVVLGIAFGFLGNWLVGKCFDLYHTRKARKKT